MASPRFPGPRVVCPRNAKGECLSAWGGDIPVAAGSRNEKVGACSITKTSKWFGLYRETRADVKGFPADVKSIELIKNRPVVIQKDRQIIRLTPSEKLDTSAPCRGLDESFKNP